MQQYTAGLPMNPACPACYNPPIFFAHGHYCVNAGQNAPWNRGAAYSYDFTVPEPVPPGGKSNWTSSMVRSSEFPHAPAGCHRRLVADRFRRRNRPHPDQQDLGRRRSVEPYAVSRRPTHRRGDNNSGGCLVGIHSGPDIHDHPQLIIHQPDDPFGLTDEMFSEHAGSSGGNVLFGDGSVRFISSFIDGDTWWYLSTMNVGDLPNMQTLAE